VLHPVKRPMISRPSNVLAGEPTRSAARIAVLLVRREVEGNSEHVPVPNASC